MGVYIPQIDCKDLWISNFGNNTGYTVHRRDGELNTNKFRASFDTSLDLIKLREIYETVYRNKRFSSFINDKEYCYRIINVTFEYSVKTFNRINYNTYIRLGTKEEDVVFEDCVCIIDGELCGIKTEEPVENPIDSDILGKYFSFKDGCYINSVSFKTERSVAGIRKDLYSNGFTLDGIKFVRWKRSAGSARVGRCLFIDERLYDRMHKWESCGLDIKVGDKVDLAAFESYISLTASSITDTLVIEPKNILIIDDFESVFDDDVINVTEKDGVLQSEETRTTISNDIFDGESLIDKSLMGKYSNKGMVLLRNRFFKSCAFNCNIQQWFKDNNITDVSQLNGYTRADKVEDVKFITTANSIKFIKFGTIDEWLDRLETTFGLVKYEKPPHFFGGRLVQSHYQLINSIQLTKQEVDKLLEPTFDFLTLIKTKPEVYRYWIKFKIQDLDEITPLESKTDIIYKLMSISEDFCKTKLYYDFRADFLRSFCKNLKCGRVLINGNYSTICGNPIEMLKMAIGEFDGSTIFEKETVSSKRFAYGKPLLCSRSPHITFSNVLCVNNKRYPEIDKYMNATREIIFVNSISENIMEKLAGADFDSDTVLVTDNSVLIKAAKRNDKRFKVAVNNVGGMKIQRKYTASDLADLDIKTSKNLIGEIINMSQELNTRVWDMLADGKTTKDVMGIYMDICKLSIMSNIEIDKAKKEFAISNAAEFKKIRDKHELLDSKDRQIKPYFFAHIARRKGYYDNEKRAYIKHDTAMDYLQLSVNKYRARRTGATKNKFMPFSEMINSELLADGEKANYRQINELFNFIDSTNDQISSIYANKLMDPSDQVFIASSLRQDCIEYIGKMSISPTTMITMLKAIEKPEHAQHRKLIFYTLFGYPNSSFFRMLKSAATPIKSIIPDTSGDINIYGTRFTICTK